MLQPPFDCRSRQRRRSMRNAAPLSETGAGLVNARNRACDHVVGHAFDSALDFEASEVRKLTALMLLMHGISDASELSVTGELYQGYCVLRGD